MTLAVTEAPPRKRRRPPVRAESPSLGWGILAWTYQHLRSPLDETQPLRFTNEQANRIVDAYRVDRETGRRLYRRVHFEDAKGWGKSPLAAAIALAEFAGPVCFDGWDANGEPVGVAWGTRGRPAPWVQIAAVSEDQTANTSNAVLGFLVANDGKVADELHIDVGRTRLYRTDDKRAFLERVTASAGSREGQPVTFAVLDEPQLWTPSNGGPNLAHTILRNTAKTNGWTLLTGNAPIIGIDSVAEMYAAPAAGALHFMRRPSVEPEQDWPRERKREMLAEVYGDAWWIDLDRLLDEIADPAQPWRDSLRFFFNLPDDARADLQWMPLEAWEACEDRSLDMVATEPVYACVRVAHDHRSAALAWAQRRGDRVVVRSRVFDDDELYDEAVLDVRHIEAALLELHRIYRGRVLMPKRYSPKGKERFVPVPGPEVAYHGSFFERSAQVLSAKGMALIDLPDSQERLAPASETLLELALSGKLAHDGDAELAAHVYAVDAKPAVKGWTLSPHSDRVRIHAATAAMHAVHRAMHADRPQSRRVRGLR